MRPGPPDLRFTYRLFYKAPDLIGPAVCRAFGLPYLVAEASYAPKRDSGPWADRQERVRDALGLADHVFFLNPVDEACVIPLLKPRATHSRLLPAAVWAVAVGMMRPGDKPDSYRRLADAWMSRPDSGAHLPIVGDGAAGAEVRRFFSGCETRIAFLGILPKDVLNAVYRAADLYVWPGANEAIGMATLEAMAAGLPVAVGPWGSVAQGIESGVAGRAHVRRRHGLPAAADAMTAAFEDAAGRTP